MEDKKNNKKSSDLDNAELNPPAGGNKNPWQILMFALIIVALLYLFNVFFGFNNDIKETEISDKKAEEKIEVGENFPKSNLKIADKEEMRSNYRGIMDDIKESFLSTKEKNTNEQWVKFTHDSLDKMFKTVVPLERKAFHLKLTLTLNTINKLAVSQIDDNQLKEEIERLDGILGEWQ